MPNVIDFAVSSVQRQIPQSLLKREDGLDMSCVHEQSSLMRVVSDSYYIAGRF